MTKEDFKKRLTSGLGFAGHTQVTLLVEALPQVRSQGERLPESGPAVRASTTEDSSQTLTSRAFGDSLGVLTRELAGLRAQFQRQSDMQESNTRATIENTLAKAAGGVLGQFATSTVSSFGGGLVSPLISGLTRLFRGAEKEPVDPLTYYVPPPPVHLQAGLTRSGRLEPVSYGSEGSPRTSSQYTASPQPSITVQVNAIDSRSFMDHSHEIARAVREALLSSHALSDVVAEL